MRRVTKPVLTPHTCSANARLMRRARVAICSAGGAVGYWGGRQLAVPDSPDSPRVVWKSSGRLGAISSPAMPTRTLAVRGPSSPRSRVRQRAPQPIDLRQLFRPRALLLSNQLYARVRQPRQQLPMHLLRRLQLRITQRRRSQPEHVARLQLQRHGRRMHPSESLVRLRHPRRIGHAGVGDGGGRRDRRRRRRNRRLLARRFRQPRAKKDPGVVGGGDFGGDFEAETATPKPSKPS